MKKCLLFLSLIMAFTLAACSNIDTDKQSTNKIDQGSDGSAEVQSEDSNTELRTEESTAEETESEKVVESHHVSLEQNYKSPDLDVSIMGVEVFESLEAENYTDIAGEGQTFVVVYLEVNNKTDKEDYFNYNYLQSTYDGNSIDTFHLVNNPKDYNPIFNTIPPNSITQGYIVYKVPKQWNRLELNYSGWKESKGIELVFDISSDSLAEVAPYGSEYTAPYQNDSNS